MSVFRKRCKSFSMPVSNGSFVRNLRIVKSVVDGHERSQEVLEDVSLNDYFNANPISFVDLSLDEQLQAGVKLDEVPCSTLLDSTDNLDYDVNDSAEQFVLDKLNEEIKNEDKNEKNNN